MKPFLGIDLTTDKMNRQVNGAEFLISKPSLAMEQSFEHSSGKAKDTIKHSKLPLPLRIVQGICGVVGLVVFAGLVKSLGGDDGVSIGQAYQNASWLFWLGGVCLLIWGILKVISRLKEKNVLGKEESTQAFTKLEGVCDAIYSELSVPSNAKDVDILSFFYKEKDGNIKACEKGLQIAPYFNPVFKVFADSENLYLANLKGKYAFPLSAVVSIHTVKKHIRITGWNKEEKFNKGIYKQFMLAADNYGCIRCKCYHILEINHNGESMGIYFPCYEWPVFEEITK